MPDLEDLSIVIALGAVVAAVWGLMSRDSGRTVINVPDGFGQSDGGNTGAGTDTPNAPVNLPSPDNDGGAGTDVPEEEPPGGRGPTASPSSSTIPDSLSAFDPAGRVDLINQPSTVDGDEQDQTWVGL